MPIIKESSYSKRPSLYFNAWMETLVPYFTAKSHKVVYERERLELHDGDFVDLDWVRKDSETLIIISHGFEGNSQDHFIEESASHFGKKGVDVLVWHYRSCSKDLNRLPRFYDHGDIRDLHEVITHAAQEGNYSQVILLGFSMGGNFVVNYLGSEIQSDIVKCGIVFSTPMDLSAASKKLKKGLNHLVEKSFIKKLKRKIERKAVVFPELFDLEKLKTMDSLEKLYKEYVLLHHDFSDLDQYYSKWSSSQFLPKIKIPLLIVNAQNDPLLSEYCYPYKQCQKNEYVSLETPRYGGHTGFTKKKDGKLWYLWRIEGFIAGKAKL